MKQVAHPLDHLAIIPDGNRRWARRAGIGSEKKIYEEGQNKTYEIIKAAFEAGIPHVTFWASSYANLMARPKALVSAIEGMYAKNFRDLAEHDLIHEHRVQINVYGEWRDILKDEARNAIELAIKSTSHYNDRFLTVLVGYDGRRERGQAIKAVSGDTTTLGNLAVSDPLEAEAVLRRHAWTGWLPDVDLIIRTGSWQDPHNSAGFLSLISSETQYSFPEVLWPDFTPAMLTAILDDYAGRERRHGR